MDLNWKFFLYDWGGANLALLGWLQPEAASIGALAWLVSIVASYWGAPLVLSSMAWWSGRASDRRNAEAIDCQMRRFVLSALMAFVATWALKHALNLPRPYEITAVAEAVFGTRPSTGSLPSGHSVYAALLAAALWPVLSRAARVVLVAFVLAVGWSRVAQGLHFPADIVMGWIVGLACAALARRIVLRLAPSQRSMLKPSREGLPGFIRVPSEPRPSSYGWWTLGFAITGLDLIVKAAVHSGLPYGISISVTDYFNIVHRWNTGAAFSFLANAGGWQRYLFIGLALTVSGFLLWRLRRPLPRAEALVYTLIVGGALGNATDRIVRGYVVDYLDFHWAGFHWPAFNVADISITLAIGVLIATSFKGPTFGAPSPANE